MLRQVQCLMQDSNLRRRKPTDLQFIPDICAEFPLTGVAAGRGLGLAHIHVVVQRSSAPDSLLAHWSTRLRPLVPPRVADTDCSCTPW